MQKISLLILFLAVLLSASAQNIDKFYIQSTHKEGLLYFVFPQKMDVHKEAKDICKKSLSYDYTYLDANDSVSVLMTLFISETFIPDQVHISIDNGSTVIDRQTEMLFIEPQKGKWKIRVKASITFDEWASIYRNHTDTAPVFSFSSSEKPFTPSYQDSNKRWKKISEKFKRVLDLIMINKK